MEKGEEAPSAGSSLPVPMFSERILLHRHRLRQISRLIHIAAALKGHVVAEELHRYNVQDRREEGEGLRHIDYMFGNALDMRIPFGGDGDHPATARAHF